jgi:hypothetical protein
VQDDDSAAKCRPINSNLVLLDSQSTVDLFSNPHHVTNICPVMTPIRVHCNKGTLATNKDVDFGDTPVYFDSCGVANVLSFYHPSQKFWVTYDSLDRGGVFQVHTTQGVVEFKPTSKGLHALNLKDNPEGAYMLVNDADLAFTLSHQTPITTVRNNYKSYTKRQIGQAIAACHLMGMIASPSEQDFQGLVHLNLLKDCPVANTDITNACAIFSPNLANIRGKTVQRKPERVQMDHVDIPRAILDVHLRVTLVADVMFVNGVPFLVLASHNIHLIMIEHPPHRTAAKLGYLLQRIVRSHARAGFTIQTILMDNEFEKVKDNTPIVNLNTPAEGGHIREIKCHIWQIEEQSRGIICTLPYPKLSQQMLIHLLPFIMWLNNFPVSHRILDRLSPRELIFCHKLDYKHHCHAPFGAYCKAHEDNATKTNSMKMCGTPSICLDSTGNIHSTYNFLSLVTGLVIERHLFDELPTPVGLNRQKYLPRPTTDRRLGIARIQNREERAKNKVRSKQ